MARLPRPLGERRIFVDSSAYLALLDRDDARHRQAIEILEALSGAHFRQLTTNILIIEAHALVLSALGIEVSHRFLRSVEKGNTTVIRVRAADEARAKDIIYRYDDKDFSLADAISFAVMERLKISRAFTFDRHFSQYGFWVIAPGLL